MPFEQIDDAPSVESDPSFWLVVSPSVLHLDWQQQPRLLLLLLLRTGWRLLLVVVLVVVVTNLTKSTVSSTE